MVIVKRTIEKCSRNRSDDNNSSYIILMTQVQTSQSPKTRGVQEARDGGKRQKVVKQYPPVSIITAEFDRRRVLEQK